MNAAVQSGVPGDVCSNCGHTIGARCSRCGREFVCGRLSVPCPVGGCNERVLPIPADIGGVVEDPN